ncbi:hypothetical protein ABKW28_11030 [Nocardioides sp. 31GB23]|uniref:hypothetical protein n=1 Tax=Nocardioides sp. 31GB23 TaxID=3156065 RepID=UPI0032AEC0FF
MNSHAPIDLSQAPGARESWDRPLSTVLLWALVELLVVRNPWQLSSRLRVMALRRFGAQIGEGVIARPGLRVRFPWKLTVGDRSWIGEDVWLHNQDALDIGADVVVSQGTFITTGTHAFRTDMALRTRPIRIDDGVWVTSRCMVLGGAHIGESALILPNTVVKGAVPANSLYGSDTAGVVGQRFPDDSSASTQAR